MRLQMPFRPLRANISERMTASSLRTMAGARSSMRGRVVVDTHILWVDRAVVVAVEVEVEVVEEAEAMAVVAIAVLVVVVLAVAVAAVVQVVEVAVAQDVEVVSDASSQVATSSE